MVVSDADSPSTPPLRFRRRVVEDWVEPGEVRRSDVLGNAAFIGLEVRYAVLTAIRMEAGTRYDAARAEWERRAHGPHDKEGDLAAMTESFRFEGDVDRYLKAAGFNERELVVVDGRWRHDARR